MARVTGLMPHAKYKYRVVVEVDGAVRGVLSASVVKALGLEPGAFMEEDRWAAILCAEEADQAFDRALTYLERSSRSRADVVRHLRMRDFDDTAIEKAVEKLERYRYIDDRALAQTILRDRVRLKGSGRRQIREALVRKGIGREDIEAALAGYGEDEARDNAREQLARMLRRYAAVEDPRERRRKVAAALLRKGYEWDTISPLLAELDSGEDDF